MWLLYMSALFKGIFKSPFKAKEFLAGRLATIHNLYFMNNFMLNMRSAIKEGQFTEFYNEFRANYRENNSED